MNEWTKGKFKVLVETTLRQMKASLTCTRGTTTSKQRVKVFHGRCCKEIRGVFRYLTNRETGGVLYSHETDEKSCESVLNVLKSNHPNAKVPDVKNLHPYSELPDFVDLDITGDTVETVAHKLRGSASPGGANSIAVQHWLLQFGEVSSILCNALAKFIN
jgi:hypothetical protein